MPEKPQKFGACFDMTISIGRAERFICHEYFILSFHDQIVASADLLIIQPYLCSIL